MKNLIQIDKDGNPVEHPILLEVFIQAFPEIYLDIEGDAPEGYAWHERPLLPKEVIDNQPDRTNIKYRYVKKDNYFIDEYYYEEFSVEQHSKADEYENNYYLNLAINIMSDIKTKAFDYSETAITDSEKEAWQTYFGLLSEIPETITQYDIIIPKMPIKNESGQWIKNLDNEGNWVTRLLLDKSRLQEIK